jgi:hypothetical protein
MTKGQVKKAMMGRTRSMKEEEEENANRLLVWNPEGTRPLRRQHRRVDKTEINFEQIEMGGMDRIGLTQVGTSALLL